MEVSVVWGDVEVEGARLTADMRSVTESSSSQAALCSQTLIIVMLTRHRQPRPAPRTTNQQPLQNVNRKSCSEQDQVKWSSNSGCWLAGHCGHCGHSGQPGQCTIISKRQIYGAFSTIETQNNPEPSQQQPDDKIWFHLIMNAVTGPPAACTFVNVITAGTEHCWAILGALDCLRLHLDNSWNHESSWYHLIVPVIPQIRRRIWRVKCVIKKTVNLSHNHLFV